MREVIRWCLGEGKNTPLIVLDEADPDQAVQSIFGPRGAIPASNVTERRLCHVGEGVQVPSGASIRMRLERVVDRLLVHSLGCGLSNLKHSRSPVVLLHSAARYAPSELVWT